MTENYPGDGTAPRDDDARRQDQSQQPRDGKPQAEGPGAAESQSGQPRSEYPQPFPGWGYPPEEQARQYPPYDPSQQHPAPEQPQQQPYRTGQPQAYGAQPYQPDRPQPYPAEPYPAEPYQPGAGYGPHTQQLPPYGAAPPSQQQPPQGGRRPRPARTALLAAVIAALIGGGIGAGTVAAFDHNQSAGAAINVTNQSAPVSAQTDGTITAAAAKIQPSVVTINVTGSQEQGTGSGVIIRSDGYILTNDHVVSVAANGGTIQVVTNDGRQANATVVGVDASDDLAVIKVNLPNLTAATFGKSSELVVGQTVVAVGAPLGLSDTVTSGIVSNTARPVVAGDNDQAVFDAVQTDAAINPGNSGGPLVDLNGNVVGINAAIATANSGGLQIPGQQQQSGSIGIGFAIPSDEASRIANELIANGKSTHAIIGVNVNQGQANQSGTVGATIASIEAGSPAAKAGLKAGDVVTKVDSQLIDDATGLIAAIRSHAPGQTVTLTYLRGGASHTAPVTLGTSPN